MAEVGSAFLSIIPTARGFGAKLSALMDPEMASSGRTSGTKFGEAFSSAGESQLRKFGAAAKWGGLALAGLGVVGVKAGLETAASMENAKISFTTMLGSAQKASAFIKDLGAFAAKTPFEFPELQTAASSLISAGVNASKVIPIMTTLGDVTSGMGTGSEGIKRATVALQQMIASQKISGEDLNQLRDAGIPVYDLLAKATGRSKAEVVKLAQAGKLGKSDLDAMMKALESGKGLERFKGLMAKQSASLGGIWSTFKDNLNMSLSQALAPSLPGLKSGLSSISAALPGLIHGFVQLVTPMVKLGKWIVDSKPVLAGLATVLAVALLPAMVAATIATWSFTAALLANPLTWLAVGLALIVAAIVLLVQHWDLIKAKTIAVWNTIKTFLIGLWDGLKAKMAAAWDAIKNGVVSKAQSLLAFVKTLPQKILDLYLFLPRKMLALGESIATGLRDGISNAWHFVTDKVQALIAKIPLAIRKLLGIASPSKVMAEQVGRWIPAGIALGIDRNSGAVRDSMTALTSGLSMNARLSASSGLGIGPAGATPADRPIYMDGSIVGVLREQAKGVAELVLNQAVFAAGALGETA